MKKRHYPFLIIFISIVGQSVSGSLIDYDEDGQINEEDCAPYNPLINGLYADEICNDNIDNDCDLWIDEEDEDCLIEILQTRSSNSGITQEETKSDKQDNENTSKDGKNILYIIIPIAILAGAGILLWEKHQKEPSQTQPTKVYLDPDEQNLQKYVQQVLEQGSDKKQIIEELKKRGWPEDKIARIFTSLGK